MKLLFALAPLVLAATALRADIVIEQKMESAFLNGNMTMKLKGDNARMDMPGGPAGAMTMIMNGKSGEMTTLIHSQKMAMKMNIADAKKQAESAQKLTGLEKLEAPKATGKTEKVGEWDAEIYEMATGTNTAKLWVAKDFPNFQAISAQMNKLSALNAAGGFDTSKFNLPGMVVKSEMNTPVGKVTTTLVKAKEENVEEKEFVLPEGYQEIKAPAFGK